ncbi:M15 family metallopeptidase [Sorangium sp. So ce385]|uniref:M15 family metallopeptidase n=1 Tax=Sorangium sp. So ce385 TaxID=3133308 RepID=UPI003F5B5111
MITRVLQRGLRGDDVAEWQLFLIGQRLDPGLADGIFGAGTLTATQAFQTAHHLDADGKVGRHTLARALQLGFGSLHDPEDQEERGPNWPPRPDDLPTIGLAARQALFGKFDYAPDPHPQERERIRVLGSWAQDNIVTIEVPQLVGKKRAAPKGRVTCHRLAADQICALFAAWERAGLLDRVLTWDGCYNPRFVRGSDRTLSQHAFGSAFDINADQNGYGVEPARVGKPGCVRELVQIANELGFFWGGHFSGRLDGMHFEIARLMEVAPPISLPVPGARPLAAPADADTAGPRILAGSAFYDRIRSLAGQPREDAIHEAITSGSTPDFLQSWQPVHLSAVDAQGVSHTGVVYVQPDYLCVGTNEDFFRVPMAPLAAQRLADALGCVLPTTKLVDRIHAQAALRLVPRSLPPHPEMTSTPYFKRHDDLVEAQRAGRAIGSLVAGHKKDVVITNRLLWRPRRVAIYGWHSPNGAPIQPLSTAHDETYADYSHGIRLVKATMVVDGKDMAVADVLRDPRLHALLSDEGPLRITAYGPR